MSFFKRLFSSEKKETLDRGLARTKRGVLEKLSRAVMGKKDIDADVLEWLKNQGNGYQTRLNQILRDAMHKTAHHG